MNVPNSILNDVSAIKTVLIELAGTALFERHPFRLLELPVEASTRDISRRRQAMEQATRNQLLPPPGSVRILPRAETPTDDDVRTAGHELSDARRRLVQELFWFWPIEAGGQSKDEALRALVENDFHLAHQTWKTKSKEESHEEQSAAAWHNLAVYALYVAIEVQGAARVPDPRAVREAWSTVWSWWLPLSEENHAMWQRVRSRIQAIEDPALKSGAAESLRRTLPTALALLQMQMAIKYWDVGQQELAKLLLKDAISMGSSAEVKAALEEARRIMTEPLRGALQKHGESAQNDARNNKKQACTALEHFLEYARPVLEKIDLLIPSGVPQRVNAHDNVALAGLTCQISYGNETRDWNGCVTMLETCLEIAEGEAAKGRLNENLKIVRSNAESDAFTKQCWFCGESGADSAMPMEVPLHGNVETTWVPGGSRTTWSHATIKVPRCPGCKNAHAKEAVGVGVGFLVLIVGIVLGCVIGSNTKEETGFIVAGLGLTD